MIYPLLLPLTAESEKVGLGPKLVQVFPTFAVSQLSKTLLVKSAISLGVAACDTDTSEQATWPTPLQAMTVYGGRTAAFNTPVKKVIAITAFFMFSASG